VGTNLTFTKIIMGVLVLSILSFIATPVFAEGDGEGEELHGGSKWKHADNTPVIPDSRTKKVATGSDSDKNFKDRVIYEEKEYSSQSQVAIYGGKYPIKKAPAIAELGRDLYGSGEVPEAWNIFGKKNPTFNRFIVSGDFLLAANYADNGDQNNIGQLAAQLNLDLDWKITGTERIHAFIRPLEDPNNRKTRYTFSGGVGNGLNDEDDFNPEVYFNPEALFLEGDLGSIWAGITGEDPAFDLPFAVGLIRLFFQNGIWVDDFFTGLAFTIPAMNSPLLGISNMDITFFAGFDEIETFAIGGQNVNEQDAKIFGFTMFIEALEGYWEVGYGYTYFDDNVNGNNATLAATNNADDDELDYHSITIAYSRRYGGIISNSIRFMANVGQTGGTQTADGFLVLVENSFITSLPSTLIPYFNMFMGYNNPVRLAGQNDILQNTGINFEDDFSNNLTTLNNTAQDTYGAALGVEYLFSLDKQIVVELAYLREFENGDNAVVDEWQAGGAIRFQMPINNATILRADAQYSINNGQSDISSIRLEIRRKF